MTEPIVVHAEDMGENGLAIVNINRVKLTPEQIINELVYSTTSQLTSYEEKLKEYEAYKKLTITDVSDKEGYEAIRIGIGVLRTSQSAIELARKSGKGLLTKAGKSIDAKADEIDKKFQDIRNEMQAKKDKIDEEKAEIKRKKDDEENLRFAQRTGELIALGALVVGDKFVLDDAEYSMSMVKDAESEFFQERIVGRFAEIKKAKDEEKRLAEEKAAEELAELNRQKEQLKKEQDELNEKLRLQKEKEDEERLAKEKKERELLDVREGRLKELGAKYFHTDKVWILGEARQPSEELKTMDQEGWVNQHLGFTKEKERLDQIAADKLEEERKAEEKRISEKAIADKAEKDKKEREEKQRKLDESDDVTKWEDFMAKITAIVPPTFKSRQYKNIGIEADAYLMAIKKLKAKRNS